MRPRHTIIFLTIVTCNRLPIVTDEVMRNLLHHAGVDTRECYLFQTKAVVLLPNYLNTIWT